MRASDSPALIWSVEVGIVAARLHLNLLGPAIGAPNIRNAAVHVEECVKPARAVAAYITKRAGMPSRQIYAGRLVGTAGHIMQYLAHAEHMPAAQAGALLKIIETARFNRAGHSLSGHEIHTDLHKIITHYVAELSKLDTLRETKRPEK